MTWQNTRVYDRLGKNRVENWEEKRREEKIGCESEHKMTLSRQDSIT